MREEAGTGAAGGGPGLFVSRGLHGADDIELPGVLVTGAIAQTLEGDGDLHFISEVGEAPLGTPDIVGRRSVASRPLAVLLWNPHRWRRPFPSARRHSGCRTDSPRRPAPVDCRCRCPEELDVVVLGDLVAIGECGPHGPGRRIGPYPHVQRGPGIPDQHLGAVLRRHAVIGEELGETRECGGLLPDGFIEYPIDVIGGVEAGIATAT